MSAARPLTQGSVPAMPTAAALGRLLSHLVGVPVTSVRLPASDAAPYLDVVSIFGNAGRVAAVMCADLEFTAATAAALSLMPLSEVTRAVRTTVFAPDLWENATEICNVMGSLFCKTLGPSIRFEKHLRPRAKLPAQLAMAMQRFAGREDFEVTLRGSRGRVALFTLDLAYGIRS